MEYTEVWEKHATLIKLLKGLRKGVAKACMPSSLTRDGRLIEGHPWTWLPMLLPLNASTAPLLLQRVILTRNYIDLFDLNGGFTFCFLHQSSTIILQITINTWFTIIVKSLFLLNNVPDWTLVIREILKLITIYLPASLI